MSKQIARPFLKWAGGKIRLIDEIRSFYPFNEEITKYAEPFVGGGSVLFDILGKHDLKEIYVSDANHELINSYLAVRDRLDELIESLELMQSEFIDLDHSKRKSYYLEKRDQFNELILNGEKSLSIEKASLMIFLNKTCYNGLYRVNRSGAFNVPIMGGQENPIICDRENLVEASRALQGVIINCESYENSASFIDESTFVYIDPPYRPITETSSHTAYSKNLFTDQDQVELSNFVKRMSNKGAKILVSNSDPRSVDPEDDFFDMLYYGFYIYRVDVFRAIGNSRESRRKVKELLISNFKRRRE